MLRRITTTTTVCLGLTTAAVADTTGLPGSAVSFVNDETTASRFEGFTVTGGTGTIIGAHPHGGGMYLNLANPIVKGCVFTGNTAAAGGGVAALNVFQAAFIDCLFTDNTATSGGSYGGGGMYVRAGRPDIINCAFIGNRAIGASKGGGLSIFLGAAPTLTNCLVFANEARHGGGIMNDKASPTLVNCTVAANTCVGSGGGMRSLYAQAQPTVTNSIFWDNSAGVTGDEILDQADAASTVSFSNVEGGWFGAGSDNGATDPMFVDPSAGDLRLRSASPCIDAGLNDAVDADTDLDGNDRIAGTVDLGPYEHQGAGTGPTCDGDFDGDGGVEFDDLVLMLMAWGSCSGCPQDLDGDGDVRFDDLLLLLDAWGTCP
jgi:hypothetical protein